MLDWEKEAERAQEMQALQRQGEEEGDEEEAGGDTFPDSSARPVVRVPPTAAEWIGVRPVASPRYTDTCMVDGHICCGWKYMEHDGKMYTQTKCTTVTDNRDEDEQWRIHYTAAAHIESCKDELGRYRYLFASSEWMPLELASEHMRKQRQHAY